MKFSANIRPPQPEAHRYWDRPRPPEPKDTKEGRVPDPWWRRLLKALRDPPPLPPLYAGPSAVGRFPIRDRFVTEEDVTRVLDRFEDYRARYEMSPIADHRSKPRLRALVRAILEEVTGGD